MTTVTIRQANPDTDEDVLRELDLAEWTSKVSPAPPPEAGRPFFGDGVDAADVLVAERDDGEVLGYVRLGRATPLSASDHVRTIDGLAVSPAAQGAGVGRKLVEAAIEEAGQRGASKVTLRVLAHNEVARRLYARTGFEVEGTLRGEFVLDGRPVDDLLLARHLSVSGPAEHPA